MNTLLLALTLLACLSLSTCGGSEDDPRVPGGHPVGRELFGINTQMLQPLPAVARLDDLERHLDSVAELGVDFARTNSDWRIIEPKPL